MGIREYVTYGLVAAAVFALVWALFGRQGESGGEYRFADGRETGWRRLPTVFKALWLISIAYEDTLGVAIANRFPRKAEKLGEYVLASALPLNPARVFCASAFLGILLGFVGLVAGALLAYAIPSRWGLSCPVILVALFVIVGVYWPMDSLRAYAMRRRRELTRQLPFAIDLLNSAMRSGLEFGAALRYYTKCGVKGALPEEFTQVLSELTLGKTMTEALERMAGRVGVPGFTSFVDSVAFGRDVGSPIVHSLKVHGVEMRRDRFALAERKAGRAPQLMIIPLICFILPATFIVMGTPIILQFLKIVRH